MARKRYYFKDRNKVGVSTTYMPGTNNKISIGAEQNDYRTSSLSEQRFIESHPFFKGKVVGKIVDSLPGEDSDASNAPAPSKPAAPKTPADAPEQPEPDANQGGGAPAESESPEPEAGAEAETGVIAPAVFLDVTDINGAVAVLRGEPYKISHLALKTPEKVRSYAEVNNVSFPNWTE